MDIDWFWTIIVAFVCGGVVLASEHWKPINTMPQWKRAIAAGIAAALIIAVIQLAMSA